MDHRLLQLFVKTIFMVCLFVTPSHCEPGCILKSIREMYVFDCGFSNLTRVPSYLNNSQIRVLYLHYNKISILRSNDFVHYSQLEKIDLRGNAIRSIEEHTFIGLPRLRKLDLSENFIRFIHPNSWGPLTTTLSRLTLSSNFLTQLPNLSNMAKLRSLDVSNNHQIKEIESGSFPSSLSELALHYTGIKLISRSLFENLHNLKSLHLQDLSSSSSVIFDVGAFDNLTRLRHLDLSRTFCNKLPTNSFRNLKNLRILRMKNCWMSEMPRLFAEKRNNQTKPIFFTPKLQELDVSTNRRMSIYDGLQRFPSSLRILSLAKVKLPKIDSSMFHNMKQLQVLDIRQSKTANIDDDAFRDLESIQKIFLSNNPFEISPDIPQGLRSLNISFTKLRAISVKMMKNINFVNAVNLSSNEIENIEPASLQNLTYMRILDLSSNKLRSIGNTSIGMSSNGKYVNRIASKCPFQNLDNLEKLFLSSNRIDNIHVEAFKDLKKLQILDLSDNMLTTLGYETLRHLINLKELDLSGNDFATFGIVKSLRLEHLDISHNRLQELPVWKENNLKTFKASHNELSVITAQSFDGLGNIEEINLAGNQIHRIDYGAFTATPFLRHLDLSNNDIEKFLDVRIPNLQVLRLSNNDFTTGLTGKLEDLCPLLRVLELGHNKISYIDPAIFDGIFSLTQVDFSWNEFQCDCSLKPFLHWMDQNDDIIQNEITYACPLPEIRPMLDVVRHLNCDKKEPSDREMNDASSDSDFCICLDM